MRRHRHYYYPRRRTAYGPRRRRLHTEECVTLTARDFAESPRWAHLVERVPMPRGHGERVYVRCPLCGRRCQHLYCTSDGFYPWQCRACAGLIYWSQYEGRRAEADLERIFRKIGRYRNWQPALAIWREREVDHGARAWLSIHINQLRWQQHVAYVRRLDELNAAAAQGYEAYQAALRGSPHTAKIVDLTKRIRRLERQRRRDSRVRRAA